MLGQESALLITFSKNQKFHLKPERAKSNVTKLFPIINNSPKIQRCFKFELSFRINILTKLTHYIAADGLGIVHRLRVRTLQTERLTSTDGW